MPYQEDDTQTMTTLEGIKNHAMRTHNTIVVQYGRAVATAHAKSAKGQMSIENFRSAVVAAWAEKERRQQTVAKILRATDYAAARAAALDAARAASDARARFAAAWPQLSDEKTLAEIH